MLKMFLMQTQTDKPPGSAAAAKAAAVLRAEIKMELQNKKQCSYKPFACTQLTLDGYGYCLRHILCDKSAPFKQCSFVYPSNGKRCFLPAKVDKKDVGYCSEHALKAHLLRSKQGCRPAPPRTAEALLGSLSHYVKRPRSRNVSSSTQHSDEGRISPDEGDPKVTRSLDPFVEIDASHINASCSDVLDMCSESESDVEPATYTSVWQDAQADSSDDESIDSEQEDILKHANVYSAEEITMITRDKLSRLQTLYIDQYRHLQHMLKEKRRKYLIALKREKETCCSISNQSKDNPKEQRMYRKLKDLNHYHKKVGTDAILRKRLNELRMKITDGAQHKPQNYNTKCAYIEGGVKCTEKSLPVARHCRKHILEDPNQVLFRACGRKRADIECPTPVEAIFDDQTCILHRDIPPLRSYSQVRKDSESDYDDMTDLHANNPNVKTELIDYSNIVIPTNLLDSLINNESTTSMDSEVDLSLMNSMKCDMDEVVKEEEILNTDDDMSIIRMQDDLDQNE